MSDVTGPPAPKTIDRSVQSSGKTSQVAKDPNNAGNTQNRQQTDTSSKENAVPRSRDPAVSISASAAQVRIGQELRETVNAIDAEGRPVIVTETATFALRPDAGLQPDDTVVLKITETGKTITADLTQRNNYVVTPPTQLALIITEIHIPQQSQQQNATKPLETPTNHPYRAPLSSPVRTETIIPETRSLLLNENALTSSSTQSGLNVPAEKNLHPTSSANLLNAQQSGQTNDVTEPLQRDRTPSQISSATNPQAATGPGIGPAIAAISSDGAQAIIQVLDPAISQVSPAKIATVSQVSPLSAAHAVLLGTGGNLLTAFDNSAALSVVETDRGTYIAPSDQVTKLTGEIVRLDVALQKTATASSATTVAANTVSHVPPTFSALLISSEDGSYPQKVSVSFVKPENTSSQANTVQTATINTVQTQAAFLSPDGPKTDIRLLTTAGDVSLTIPSSQRPAVGDTIEIRWPSEATLQASASTQLPTTSTPEVSTRIDAQQTSAASTGILTNWPALQEAAVAIAASNNPAAITALQEKTAQGGGKLTNSLLFLLAAAGRSGANAWIGRQVENTLQTTTPALLKQLTSDIRQMGNMANDRSGEWRAIMIPVDTRSTDVPLAALLVQQHAELNPDDKNQTSSGENNEQDDNKRFVLQVQFSVLGDIQLDGQIKQKQFDLTVRSKTSFDAALQNELRKMFDVSVAVNGYTGALSFEEQYPFDIDAQDIIEKQLVG
ncbi:hypothetical protein [Kordiimonas aquimaris]|uniref:hypothetical protein n=1 Tax=Kordiimonas aquimaris TaxID=707591 RepID=UPI0021D099A5|nr:hypothetical protein [Kordiimonas aquimaris]